MCRFRGWGIVLEVLRLFSLLPGIMSLKVVDWCGKEFLEFRFSGMCRQPGRG